MLSFDLLSGFEEYYCGACWVYMYMLCRKKVEEHLSWGFGIRENLCFFLKNLPVDGERIKRGCDFPRSFHSRVTVGSMTGRSSGLLQQTFAT